MKLPNVTIQISADTVAWYGAILSTIGLFSSIINYWNNRARVYLKFQSDMRDLNDFDKPMVWVTAINKGNRPVKIKNAWLKIYGVNDSLLLTQSSKEMIIDERNPSTTIWSYQEGLDIDNIYLACVSDERGRIYKKYIKKFPEFTKLWRLFKSSTKKIGFFQNFHNK